MNEETFWQIIEETHDTSMERHEEKLLDRLKRLPEDEIVEFERLATLRNFDFVLLGALGASPTCIGEVAQTMGSWIGETGSSTAEKTFSRRRETGQMNWLL